MRTERQTVLRLLVRNHPGVMSHLCGLFARRAFNVEGILCVPLEGGERSAVLLLVADDQRNTQIVAQLRKLEDVVDVRPDPGARSTFDGVARHVRPGGHT